MHCRNSYIESKIRNVGQNVCVCVPTFEYETAAVTILWMKINEVCKNKMMNQKLMSEFWEKMSTENWTIFNGSFCYLER